MTRSLGGEHLKAVGKRSEENVSDGVERKGGGEIEDDQW